MRRLGPRQGGPNGLIRKHVLRVAVLAVASVGQDDVRPQFFENAENCAGKFVERRVDAASFLADRDPWVDESEEMNAARAERGRGATQLPLTRRSKLFERAQGWIAGLPALASGHTDDPDVGALGGVPSQHAPGKRRL